MYTIYLFTVLYYCYFSYEVFFNFSENVKIHGMERILGAKILGGPDALRDGRDAVTQTLDTLSPPTNSLTTQLDPSVLGRRHAVT